MDPEIHELLDSLKSEFHLLHAMLSRMALQPCYSKEYLFGPPSPVAPSTLKVGDTVKFRDEAAHEEYLLTGPPQLIRVGDVVKFKNDDSVKLIIMSIQDEAAVCEYMRPEGPRYVNVRLSALERV